MAVLIALLSLAAGCGGSDDSPSGSGEIGNSARHAEFLEQASAVCARREERLRRELLGSEKSQQSRPLPRRVVFAKLEEVTLPAIEAQIGAFRRLKTPLEDFDRVNAVLTRQKEAVMQLRGLGDVRSFAIVEIHFAEADEMLRDFGLDTCAVSTIAS
jgi:hypothetical protein